MENYRIVRLTACAYRLLIDSLYNNDRDLIKKSYEEQQKTIFDRKLVFTNGFSMALKSLGHEVHDIICDIKPLQYSWTKENDFIVESNDWISEISLAQLIDIQPEILFLQNIDPWPADILKNIKIICPSIKKIAVYVGFPQASYERFSNVDLFFGGDPSIKNDAMKSKINAHLMYPSFDKEILDIIEQKFPTNESEKYDFIFSGSYGAHHRLRYRILKSLLEHTNLKCWVVEFIENKPSMNYSPKSALKKMFYIFFRLLSLNILEKVHNWSNNNSGKYFKMKIASVIHEYFLENSLKVYNDDGKNRLLLPVTKKLSDLYPNRVFDPVFGLEMYRLFLESKIVFNKNVDEGRCLSIVGNNRMFDATGMGTCLLTDTGINMSNIFEENTEVVTYRSIEEAIEKVNYLLSHEKERKKIALAGQKRTLKDHTVLNRAVQMNELLQEIL